MALGCDICITVAVTVATSYWLSEVTSWSLIFVAQTVGFNIFCRQLQTYSARLSGLFARQVETQKLEQIEHLIGHRLPHTVFQPSSSKWRCILDHFSERFMLLFSF